MKSLLALSREGRPDEVEIGTGGALILDLADAAHIGDPDRDMLAAWIGALPYPVIGFRAAPGPCAGLCDVLIDTHDDLDRVTARIAQTRNAAAVLVQTLRVTSRLPWAEALVVESLAYATLQGGAEFADWLPSRPVPEAMSDGPAIVMTREGAQIEILLNRPAARNAIGVEMRDAMMEAFGLVARDESIALAHVRGAGACFSIGGALDEFGVTRDTAEAHRLRMLRLPARAVAANPARFHFHLHGACIGAGIELPAFAQRVTAAPKTFFQLPELDMGLIPGAGGCVSLPARIGRQSTAYLVLTGKRINARVALALGLIDAIED